MTLAGTRGFMLVGVAVALSACLPCSGRDPARVECANLVYARTKTSVCFSDRFLKRARDQTSIAVYPYFRSVKLASEEIFNYPFAIMSGEGYFRLTETERQNLRSYLMRGGFLLASAGCSNKAWDKAFRTEMRRIFPDEELQKLLPGHPVFQTVFEIPAIRIRHGRNGYLEGMVMNGRCAVIYACLGLNSTRHVHGCCCCGGTEILNAEEINVNILAYALLH